MKFHNKFMVVYTPTAEESLKKFFTERQENFLVRGRLFFIEEGSSFDLAYEASMLKESYYAIEIYDLEEVKEAISKSILKWHRIAYENGEDNGSVDCVLCVKFRETNRGFCARCPVNHYTGKQFCGNTPYHDWFNYQKDNWPVRRQIVQSHDKDFREQKFVFDEFSKNYAIAELQFLERLLKEYEDE